jgi:transposase-like protein
MVKMKFEKRPIVRYSLSFKVHIVNEIEQGLLTISEARTRYGIGGVETIQKWLRRFGKNHLLNKIVRVQTVNERDQLKAMQEEIKKLKEALADAHMEKRLLETFIDLANEEYHTDIKKNFGAKGSPDSGKTSQ